MMKRKQISIKWKIFAYLLCFCGILLVLLWLFQTVFLDSFYKSVKVNEVKQSAAAIVKNLGDENLADFMDDMAAGNDVYIELATGGGTRIYSSDAAREFILEKMPVYDKLKLILKTINNGGEFLGYYNRESFGEHGYNIDRFFEKPPDMGPPLENILYSRAVSDKSGETVIVFINSVISPVDATVKTLRVQLCYITGMMILFSVILAFFIARKVARPIQSINDSAKILASGKYDVAFDSSGYREINELSDTLNRTARELGKVEDLRKELIANVSHDLRTPLTLIGGYAEVMRDLPDENTPENAQVIIDETARLSNLVNDLLNLSKIQSGVQTLNLSEFNMTRLISRVIKRIGELVKKDGYKIEFLYDGEVSVRADETLISEAFYNLVINAVNYTGEDRSVTVRQSVMGHKVKVEVIDTGEGISPEELPLIWDRYYKADKSHKRPVAGTGIGLSIVKSIIEMHKGEYGAVSKDRQGSKFWFILDSE